MTASWERIAQAPNSCAHFLEFDRAAERRAGVNAGRFLFGALRSGGIAVAIATSRTASGILSQIDRLGVDPTEAMSSGRLVLHESTQMLARFTVAGAVDAQLFDRCVGAEMRQTCERAGNKPVRAFGDMVGVLWQRGDCEQAVALETFWAALQQELDFALFCTYPIDVFAQTYSADALRGVFATHTHVVQAASRADLGRVLDLAMDEVLGPKAAEVRSQIRALPMQPLPPMPKADQMILWMRDHLPEAAEAVLARARELCEGSAPRVYLREQHSRG